MYTLFHTTGAEIAGIHVKCLNATGLTSKDWIRFRIRTGFIHGKEVAIRNMLECFYKNIGIFKNGEIDKNAFKSMSRHPDGDKIVERCSLKKGNTDGETIFLFLDCVKIAEKIKRI